MIEADSVTSLVRNRASVFSLVSASGRLGFDVPVLSDMCTHSLRTLINTPVFFFSALDFTDVNLPDITVGGRFVLPFEQFGVSVKHHSEELLMSVERVYDSKGTEYVSLVGFLHSGGRWLPQSGAALVYENEGIVVMALGSEKYPSEAMLRTQDELMFTFVQCMGVLHRKPEGLSLKSECPKATLLSVAKAKKPLWTYRVLSIKDRVKAEAEREAMRSGTPKRFHKRRGFIRTLASGRKVPVRSTTVGKIENGVVYGDYSALERREA